MLNIPDESEYDEYPAEGQNAVRRLPSWRTLLHVLWLRKWSLLILSAGLALPVAVLLSLYNLPRSYESYTLMRFPDVVGAQTNMMRDVAITRQSSIIAIFTSYSLLEKTVDELGLRLRLVTPDIFRKHVFSELGYDEVLGLGQYTLHLRRGGAARLVYTPPSGGDSYTLFDKQLAPGNILSIPGLRLKLNETLVREGVGLELRLVFLPKHAVIEELQESLHVKPMGQENVRVSLEDRDPWLVADILNNLREKFLGVYYGTTQVQDISVLAQMEKDIELAKQKLERSQDELDAFYRRHPSLAEDETDAEGNLLYLDLKAKREALAGNREFLQRVNAAKEASTDQEARLWAQQMADALSQAGDPTGAILGGTLRNLKAKEADLRSELGPRHPRLKELDRELENFQLDIEDAYAAYMGKLNAEIGGLDEKIAELRARRQRQPAMKVRLELERLSATNRNNQNIYDRLLADYNRAKLATGSEFFKVTVVDEARPARYVPPTMVGRLVVAGVGSVLVFALTIGGFVFWQAIFLKVWTRGDVRRYLGLKVLGSLTYKEGMAKPSTLWTPGEGKVDPLLLHHGSMHRLEDVDAFRLIREEVENYFGHADRPGKLCLLVTSTQPHDGKSICASNLGVAFARKGRRTLLIDADLRLGRLHRIFGLDPARGIEELLDGEDLKEQEFLQEAAGILERTVQPNLILLPRRRAAQNAEELVASSRFSAFLSLARSQSDVVIIDTPPVLITSEPLSLAGQADGIVFVLRSGVTSVGECKDALEALRERNDKIATVLNQIRVSPFEANRFLKYSYYYNAQVVAEKDASNSGKEQASAPESAGMAP